AVGDPWYRARLPHPHFGIGGGPPVWPFHSDQTRPKSGKAASPPPHHIRRLIALNRRRRRSERPSLRADLAQGQILARRVRRHGRMISHCHRPHPALRHVHLLPPITIQLIEAAPNLRRNVAREVTVDRTALLNLIAEQPGIRGYVLQV